MAIINDGFFTELASGATWSAGVAFKRSNPLPLDRYSVFQTKALAEEYATTNAVAYPGQVIAVLEEGNMILYVLNGNGEALTLDRVGIVPTGDETTIHVDNGKISLKGVDALTFERDIIGEDGQPTGEKEEVQYQALLTKDGLIWIEPSKTTVEGLATLIESLTTRVGTLEGKVKTLEEKEDKDTTYSVKEGEKVLSLDGTAFGTTLKLSYTDNKIKLLGIDDVEISSFDASAFVADGVLEDAHYDSATHKLIFTWNIETGKDEEGNPVYKTDEVDIGDLIDTYTAGNGLTLDSNEFSVKVPSTDKYLTVDETGVHTKDIDEALNNKANVSDVYTKTETDKAIEDAVKVATGGETASDVLLALNNYKKAIDAEIWGADKVTEWSGSDAEGKPTYTPVYENTDSRLDQATDKLADIADGAQVNVIEKIKVNGTEQTITNKEVDITVPTKVSDLTNDSGFLTNITTPEETESYTSLLQITTGADNTTKVINDSALQAAINNVKNSAVTGITLANKDFTIDPTTKHATLSKEDLTLGLGLGTAAYKNSEEFDAAGTGAAAAKAVLGGENDGSTAKTVYGAIALANEILGTSTDAAGATTVHGALNKATKNAEDISKVSTNLDNLSKAIGTVPEGSSVIAEIEKKADKATTLAGYGITDAYTKGETDSAIATAVANAGHLKRVVVDTLPVTDIDTNTIYMKPTVGDNIFDDNMYDEYMYINGNWEKIGTTETDLTQYATKEYVDNAITDIPLATLTRGENDEVSIIAGLIKPVDKKFEVENGEVKKISTDLLVNGDNELILYGGNAGVASVE